LVSPAENARTVDNWQAGVENKEDEGVEVWAVAIPLGTDGKGF
jgi:hypothetical protein